MLTRRSRIALVIAMLLLIVVVASHPWTLYQQYRDQIGYALRHASGQWGDGSTRFVDVASQDGLHYQWTIPGPRPLDILQTIGNGCAFLDYNHSGNLSILLVGTDHVALFQGDGQGHFTDVSHATHLDRLRGHFLGCCVGDYDNDGYDDLYVSGYRTGLLLHNVHGQYFQDVTQQAGLKPQPWGTSCAWGDITGDGRLDLYIGNYVQYNPAVGPRLCAVPGAEAACPPTAYAAEYGTLYHNLGGGKFIDVTKAWGADNVSGKALGVAFGNEAFASTPSLAIANDEMPGDLLRWRGGRLINAGLASGTAETNGALHAGMGLDWGDYDNDGREDLFVGTFALEPKPLYHNLGGGLYDDVSSQIGLGGLPTRMLAFGVKWLDYDNSGWLSLMLANGHVRDNVAEYRGGATFLQPTLLFHNDGGHHFVDMSEQAGPDLAKPILGRGLAVGDFLNNGRMDALVADSQGTPLLLQNESTSVGHWLTLTLQGRQDGGFHSNRDGYGAIVVAKSGALLQDRLCQADGSYLSSSDKRVHLGLAAATTASLLIVFWPDGHRDTFHNVAADHLYQLTEGAGLQPLP